MVVVGDHPQLRMFLEDTLKAAGYTSVGVVHGATALDSLRLPTALPALLVVDLETPWVHGWMFRQALERNPHLAAVPVLVVAAEAAQSVPISADGYLPKPVDPRQFVDCVRQLTGPRAQGSETPGFLALGRRTSRT